MQDAIDIPADLCYSYSSPLLYCYTDWPIFRKRDCMNGEDGIENKIVGFCHTLGALSETPNDTQPCLSDEQVYQTVLKNVRKWIKDNPGCRVVSVTQNDNDRYCTCSKCSALAAKEFQSGVMLNFVNRLADDIAEDYPDVYLLTFAYWYTRHPPVTIKPRDNVIIWLCSIECCFSHSLDDPSCSENKKFADDIRAWSDISKQLYIWDYTNNYSRYISPFPNFKTLLPNTKFLVENRAIGIFEEGLPYAETGEFTKLRSYLIGQLLWNPDMTEEEYNALLDDFLEGYYGEGWKYVREYIDVICERVEAVHMCIFDDPLSFFPSEQGRPALTFWYDMAELWNQAEAAAADERTAANCRHSRIQADFMVASCKAIVDRKPDAELNRALIQNIMDAGVVAHTIGDYIPEYGETKYLANGYWSNIENCSPNEWHYLSSENWRERHGVTKNAE